MPVSGYKTKAGLRYRYRKMINGVWLISPSIYLTAQDAEKAEATALTEYWATGTITGTLTDSFQTVKELLTERVQWLEIHRCPRYAEETKKLFKLAMVHAPKWGQMPVSAITTNMVEKWAERYSADLTNRGKTNDNVNKALVQLQATWNHPWGKRRGKRTFPNNPFAEVDRFAVNKEAKYVPPDKHVKRIFDVLKNGEKKLYLKLLHITAARPGEARMIRWQDLQIEEPPYSAIFYTRKKNGGSLTPRKVEIPKSLAVELNNFRNGNALGYVFHQEDNLELHRTERWALNLQIEACTNAKVDYFSLHSWRHYRASKWSQEGIPLTTIQNRLGHEDATTTNLYLHELRGI
jgi:integrase